MTRQTRRAKIKEALNVAKVLARMDGVPPEDIKSETLSWANVQRVQAAHKRHLWFRDQPTPQPRPISAMWSEEVVTALHNKSTVIKEIINASNTQNPSRRPDEADQGEDPNRP